MRLYLDTNFIWGFFLNAIRAYRENPEDYEKLSFDLTKKMKFLRKARHELFTSDLAKAEVFRKLVSEMTSGPRLARRMWKHFLKTFSINMLEIKNVDFGEISELCLIGPLTRGIIQNLVQLQFAKKQKLAFATGEKRIKEYFSDYYKQIYTYIDLRQLFDSQQVP